MKIVDEFTGRVLEGRRYSEGLHQAIEAKEGVKIKEENQTLATVTIQNYFKMYDKLSGMTGTAKTQLTEFEETYKISVVEIPTNRPNVRDDEQDLIYKGEEAKWNAVAEDLKERHETGQPILVGTVSIEKSELLSDLMNRRGIAAQRAERQEPREGSGDRGPGRTQGRRSPSQPTWPGEASTSCWAGTRSTSRARRWRRATGTTTPTCSSRWTTRIVPRYEAEYEPILAKFKAQTDAEHDEVVELGGLFVLGTERHESRRIDNQLRGRSGRQGDPGESRFYLSLEDDLMRMFASDRVASIMAASEVARRRADRGEDGLEGRRERTEADRGAELRTPQERPEVRRGHERPARGDLR